SLRPIRQLLPSVRADRGIPSALSVPNPVTIPNCLDDVLGGNPFQNVMTTLRGRVCRQRGPTYLLSITFRLVRPEPEEIGSYVVQFKTRRSQGIVVRWRRHDG